MIPETSPSPPAGHAPYSDSKYEHYEVCPHQYKLIHIDKVPQQGSEAMEVGIAFHALSETYAKRCQTAQVSQDPAGMEQLLEEYAATLPGQILEELTPLGRRLATSLTVTPTLEAEQGFGLTKEGTPCDFWDPQVWFRAKLDLLDIEGSRAIIEDYKTSRKVPTPKTIDYQKQLKRYALIIMRHRPDITQVTVRLRYVRHDLLMERTLTAPDLRWVQRDLESLAGKIERETRWMPKPGPLCDYCGVRTQCTAYQGITADTDTRITTLTEAQQAADLYWVLKAKLQDVENRLGSWIDLHGPIPTLSGEELHQIAKVDKAYPNVEPILTLLKAHKIPMAQWLGLMEFKGRDLEVLASHYRLRDMIEALGIPTRRNVLQIRTPRRGQVPPDTRPSPDPQQNLMSLL